MISTRHYGRNAPTRIGSRNQSELKGQYVIRSVADIKSQIFQTSLGTLRRGLRMCIRSSRTQNCTVIPASQTKWERFPKSSSKLGLQISCSKAYPKLTCCLPSIEISPSANPLSHPVRLDVPFRDLSPPNLGCPFRSICLALGKKRTSLHPL